MNPVSHRVPRVVGAAIALAAALAACGSPDPLTGAAAARSRGVSDPGDSPGGPVAAPGDAPPGAAAPSPPADPLFDDAAVLARVNGTVITLRQVRHTFGGAWDSYLADRDSLRVQVDRRLDRMVRIRLLIDEAARLGIEVDDDEWRELLRRQEKEAAERGTSIDRELRLMGMTRREFEESLRDERLHLIAVLVLTGRIQTRTREPFRAAVDTWVSPAEVLAWGERHRDEIAVPDTVTVRVIDLRVDRFRGDAETAGPEAWDAARDAAEEILARVRAGEDFGALAREFSAGPEAASGGLLEPLQRTTGRLPVLRDWAFAPERAAGDVSPPLRGPAGWLLLRCEDRQAARTAGVEEWGPRVRERLADIKHEIALRDVEDALVLAASIDPPAVRERIRATLRREKRDLQDALR